MFRVSRFTQLLKGLPRSVFARAVQQHQADRYCKRFDSWQQLIVMLYAQLSGTSSLRALEVGFNQNGAHHYHLNCSPVSRSTLADMNARTDPQVFVTLAQALLQQVHRRVRAEGQQMLQLLDASSITLKGTGFDDWTRAHRTRHIQGLKLHMLYAPHAQVPLAQAITAANVSDLAYAWGLPIEPGVTYVMDRGYCDYRWWWHIHCQGARFVTRFKRNARLAVQRTRPIARDAHGTILKDEIVRFDNPHPGAGRHNPYVKPLRRITIVREGQCPLVLATNDLKTSALRLADAYRTRWQIELFFKWIKQHLHIKRFLGRSENAVRIQILTALIAYLLLALHARVQRSQHSLWMLLSELRASLFQRPDTERERHKQWRERKAWFEQHQTSLFT